MASELQIAHGVTGRTLYAVVRSATGSVWNGSAFAAYNGANWGTYAVTLAEETTGGSDGVYKGDFPALIAAAGVYNVEVRYRSGGSPALTDAVVGSGKIEWGGSAIASVASRAAAGDAMALTVSERGATADKLLGRSLATGADGGRTVQDALRAGRNKVAFDVPAPGQFTVFAEDDGTPAFVGTYARGANTLGPLTATDPA